MNQKALYFPDIAGKSLADGTKIHTTDICAGRISVISMLSTKISEVCFLCLSLRCKSIIPFDSIIVWAS
jgi:hypothetical protein